MNLYLKKLTMFLKKNFGKHVLAIALLISLLFGLPHIVVPFFTENYTPLSYNNIGGIISDQSTGYAPLIREAYEITLIPLEGWVKEYKIWPYYHPPLPFMMLGLIGRVTGSFSSIFIIGDFLFPAIVFLLVYYFGFMLAQKKLLGILLGVGVVIGEHLVTPSPISFFKILINYGNGFQPLEYSRLLHPQFSAISFFIALILLYCALQNNSYIFSIISGIFFGLLFYQDIYFGTYFAVALAIMTLIFFIRKKFKLFKICFLSGVIAGMLSIPHWINNYFLTLVTGGDLISRAGIELTRSPDLLILLFGIFLVAIFYLFYRKIDIKFIFITSFTLAFAIAMNIQILIGVTLQPYHWFLRAGRLFIIFIIVLLLNTFYNQRKLYKIRLSSKFLKKVFIFLIIFIMGWGIFVQIRYVYNVSRAGTFEIPDWQMESYTWLNENTEPESVIVSSSLYNNFLIPIHTHADVFLPSGIASKITNNEIIKRAILTYSLFNVSQEYIKTIFQGIGEELESKEGIHTIEFTESAGLKYFFHKGYVLREHAVAEPANLILLGLNKIQVNSTYFKKYKFDYLYYGPFEKKISRINFNNNSCLLSIYDKKDVTIFQNIC